MKCRKILIAIFLSAVLSTPAGATVPWYAPLSTLPNRAAVRCILRSESHSTEAHPNTRDLDPAQFGPFQFTPVLWNRWSWVAGVGRKARGWFLGTTQIHAVTIPAYQATLFQQAEVFAEVARVDGYGPWTNFDGC